MWRSISHWVSRSLRLMLFQNIVEEEEVFMLVLKKKLPATPSVAVTEGLPPFFKERHTQASTSEKRWNAYDFQIRSSKFHYSVLSRVLETLREYMNLVCRHRKSCSRDAQGILVSERLRPKINRLWSSLSWQNKTSDTLSP